MNDPTEFVPSSDRPGAPAGYVEVHLPDLSGRGGPGEFMLVSVPPGTYPDSVREDAAWWWRHRDFEDDPERLAALLDLAPPPRRPPRPRVRLSLTARASASWPWRNDGETRPAGYVEVFLDAREILRGRSHGGQLLRRWAWEGDAGAARRVYADYRRRGRRLAREAGFLVLGTVEQKGVFGGLRLDSF